MLWAGYVQVFIEAYENSLCAKCDPDLELAIWFLHLHGHDNYLFIPSNLKSSKIVVAE